MRYEDASQAGSISTGSEPVARPDVEILPPSSNGPGSGNAISGMGTNSGVSGADQVADGPAVIVELRGALGAGTSNGNGFEVAGQYGTLSMEPNGDFNYVRTTPADGVQDVFEYTLADANGARSSTTLTVEIPRVIDELAMVNLPAGVQMSDIKVVGRDLVIQMPDGSQMVIPGGAVFVPELTIGDVIVPPSNLAALLIESEPQPAAGPPQSSGGNFADDVPPLDPGVPLGDLIPPTELDYTPPEGGELYEDFDREPTIIIITPDNPAGAVNAVASVDESGLPERPGEPEGTLEPQNIETTTGTIRFTAEDGLESVTINGIAITAVGQQIEGANGVLTITSINLATGEIGYSYTVTDNTTDGVNDFDDFTVVVTDADGDTATGTLRINIEDDEPIARDDVDVVNLQTNSATGNVMTGIGTNAGAASGDTVGADDATLTAIAGEGGSDSSFDSNGNLVVNGEYGTLTIDAEGNYTYVPFADAPGGTEDVFTYTLTDGDGDVVTATLTIINPDQAPTAGTNPVVQLDDDALAGGNPGGTNDDPNSVNATGTLSGAGGDGQLTFDLLTTGAPPGFTYVDGPNGSILVQQVQNGVTVTVLTITVDPATGEYTVVQNANILHPDGQTENNVVFTINYTVTDADGDVATSSLTINVDDDTPLAFNDSDILGQNGQATGNVITGAGTNEGTGNADRPGADGFGGIVALAGANSSDSNPSGGYTVQGEFGSLVMDANGNYTYTRDPNNLEGGTDVFTYTYVDGDGDTVTATLTITVPNIDLVPVANAPAAVIIDDDDVAGANGNPDGVDDDDPQNATGTLTGTGGNGDLDFFFDVTATSNGLPTGFSLDPASTSTQLLIMQGTTLVMTITLNSETGEYTVVQNAPINHPDGNDENNVDFDIIFYAQDEDGDKSANETLNISVDDDTPEADENGSVTGQVDEDALADGNGDSADGDDPGGTVASGAAGSLAALFKAGADQPLTYSLNPDVTTLEDQGLQSNGQDLNYVVVDGVVYAFTGDGDLNLDGIPTTGLVFTLEVNEDGSWEFTLLDQLDHGESETEDNILIDFSGMVIATDADGDPATAAAGTFVIDVDDDLPVPAEGPDPVTGQVDEDALADGNDDNADGDDAGTTVASGAAGSLLGLFNIGADQPGKIVLLTDTSSLEEQGLQSNGQDLNYVVVEGVVYAFTGDGDLGLDGIPTTGLVFTLAVNEDGSWEFTLLDQLDHESVGTEDNILIDFSGMIGAEDADGDPVEGSLPDGSFVIDVDDDLPTANPPGENDAPLLTGVVDEDDLPDGVGDDADGDDDPTNPLNGTVVSGIAGSLGVLFNAGADQPLTYGLNPDTSSLEAQNLESGGETVNYVVVEGVVYAFTGDGDLNLDGIPTTGLVFTLEINEDGSWEFELLAQLDHPEVETEDNLLIDFSGMVIATDADGDPATAAPGTFVIDVDDDLPVLGAFQDAILPNEDDAQFNGTYEYNWGADDFGGLTVTGPEIEGITYETEELDDGTVILHGMAGTTEVFNLVVRPDGTYTFNLLEPDTATNITYDLTNLESGNANFTQTPDGLVEFTPFDHEGNDTGSVNSSNVGFGVGNQFTGNGEAFTMEFHSTNQAGDQPTGENPDFVESIAFTVPANGMNGTTVTLNWYAYNTVTGQMESGSIVVNDSNVAQQIVIDPSISFNVLVIEGSDADGQGVRLTELTVSQTILPQDQELEFEIQATDGDGDPTGTSTLTVEIDADASSSAMTATQETQQTSSAEMSATLVASNDNMDNARTFIAGNQAALMGVIAAAGLEMSGKIADVRAMLEDIRGDTTHAGGGKQAALVNVEADGGQAPGLSVAALNAADPAVSEMAEARSNTSADAGRARLDAANDDAGPAVSALAGGTQSSGAVDASAVTAAAVAMPSMEMVAALEEASHSVAASATPSVAHNQEVGRVLADALAGGNGPDIGALVDALGGGAAESALDALASLQAAGVSFGHNNGGWAFANAHPVFSMDAVAHHQDATPA